MGDLVVGIDVGTTKICTIVGEVREDDIFVVGLGIEPSRGMRKGMVVNVAQLTAAISESVAKAEAASGYEIGRAFVSLAGSHISSVNSRGVVGISSPRGVQLPDLERAIDAARAIAIPHNREVLHVIPRSYTLDGQTGIKSPLGMHGFRLEVEAHIITASSSSVQNLEQCIEGASVFVDRFILNPLASGDLILNETERDMGAMVVDIGGGTTDIAIFIDGTVWYTSVLAVGGQHVTSDIAHGLRLPFERAEQIKLAHGKASTRSASADTFSIQPFGEESPLLVRESDLAMIIEARAEEIFSLVLQECKRSGYDNLLPAGVVLTGGTSLLPGIRDLAARTLNMPVRIAQPERLSGDADALLSPAYSTSVGLLRLGLSMDLEESAGKPDRKRGNIFDLRKIGDIFKRFLPENDNE